MADSLGITVTPLEPAQLEVIARALHKLKHDLSNSLVAAMGELELLSGDIDDADLAERLQATRGQLLKPFQDLRRMTTGVPLPESAPQRWQDVQQQLDVRARVAGVALLWQPGVVPLMAAEPALRPVVAALVTNALDAAPADATVTVTLVATTTLEISDNGPGCADLRAVAHGHGTRACGLHLGLGLPVAAAILAARGGTLTLHADAPHGLRATATWAAVNSPADGSLA